MIDIDNIKKHYETLMVKFPHIVVWGEFYIIVFEDGDIQYSPSLEGNTRGVDVVICVYKYLYKVKTCPDDSMLIYFFDKNGGINDYYEHNGYKLSFAPPIISDIRAHQLRKFYIIGPNHISYSGYLQLSKCEKEIPRLWKYFIRAQKCTTQRELDLLFELYNKDSTIEELSSKIKKLSDGTL